MPRGTASPLPAAGAAVLCWHSLAALRLLRAAECRRVCRGGRCVGNGADRCRVRRCRPPLWPAVRAGAVCSRACRARGEYPLRHRGTGAV